MFKLGDKVRVKVCITDNDLEIIGLSNVFKGEEGTVIETKSDSDLVRVSFDKLGNWSIYSRWLDLISNRTRRWKQ